MSQDTTEVKDLLQAIVKARKNIRLYPENNPVYQNTIREVHQRFKGLLEYMDELKLRIKHFEIVYEDETVYENREKDESLALFFFKDGVRELSFKKGLPEDELIDFLKIISADFEREYLDDDVVTLMWERDFQYIGYVVDENFVFDEIDEGYEYAATEEVRDASAGEDEIIKAYEDAFGVAGTERVNIVPLTNEDLQAIVEEIENDPPDKSEKFMILLFECLGYAETQNEVNDIAKFMKDTIRYAIEHGSLSPLIYAMKRIGQYREETRRKYFSDVIKYINSEDIILTFGDTLERGALYEPEEIEEFSSYLDSRAIPHLLRLLGELQSMSSRKVVINILTVLGRNYLSDIAKGLRDPRWYVVRNVIYILHQVGKKEATLYLKPLIKHPDVRVRKECINALGALGAQDVLRALQESLKEEDESIRLAAIRSIAKIGGPLAKKILLDEIQSKEFLSKSFNEKKEFLEALCQWREPEVEDLIISFFRKKSFFRKAKYAELNAISAYCLGLLGTERAVEVLKKNRNHKNPVIQENIKKALKRIEDARKG